MFEGSRYFVPTHCEASCRAWTNETSLCTDGGGVLLACSSVANFNLLRNAQWWFLLSPSRAQRDDVRWFLTYCDFVLAEHNSINTDLVFGGQVSQNELNS